MPAKLLRAPRGDAAIIHAGSPAIARSLGRFPLCCRSRIFRLALRHPRLADLAVTFPGLLFALSITHWSERRRPLDLAMQGAPLKSVAAAAGVPMWMRRLPPETFVERFQSLPDGDVFRRRITNHLPRSPKLAAFWLGVVRDAARWGDDDVAVWIARELVRDRKTVTFERLRLVSLYAWYSRRPGTSGHDCVRSPWHHGMRFATAVEEARAWRELATLRVNLGDASVDPWLRPATVTGFTFVPLDSARAIADEARVMRNCVCEYGQRLAEGRERLWSMQRNGERVATLSVGYPRGQPTIDVLDLRGRANVPAPKHLWVVAQRWIGQHDLMAIDRKAHARNKVPLDRRAWTDLWRPYWMAKQRIPGWLPLAPSRDALREL